MLSVCITTYNLEKYLDQCLESVFNQKGDFDFEVLIGDDGSTDKTLAIVANWIKKSQIRLNYSSRLELKIPSPRQEEQLLIESTS